MIKLPTGYAIRVGKQNEADALRYLDLAILAGDGFHRFLYGRKAPEIMRALYLAPNTTTNYQRTVFVTDAKGNIAGAITSYSYDEFAKLNGKTEQLIYKNLNVLVIRLFISLFLMHILGFRFSKPKAGQYYIDTIAVDKKHRGRGLGKILLLAAEKRAKSLNCSSLMLNVYERNTVAIKTYEKMGFVKEESSTPRLHQMTKKI